AHQLPVEPDPLAIGPQVAVAQVGVAVVHTAGAGLLTLVNTELFKGAEEARRLVQQPAWQKGLVLGLDDVLLGPGPHHLQLPGVDRGIHGGLEPAVLIQLGAVPPAAVEAGEALEPVGNAVDTDVVGTVAEDAALP